MYLCKGLHHVFKIRAVPVSTRDGEQKVSPEEARQLAEAEHRRVSQEHHEWQLGGLHPAFLTYTTSYMFECVHVKTRLEGDVPGTCWVSVNRVDGSVVSNVKHQPWELVYGLIYGL